MPRRVTRRRDDGSEQAAFCRWGVGLVIAMFFLAVPAPAYSHPGGLDSNGGHHCRAAGYNSGQCAPLNAYHCHQPPCGGATAPTPTPAPAGPTAATPTPAPAGPTAAPTAGPSTSAALTDLSALRVAE